MVQVNGKEYNLRYSENAIEQIENLIDEPLMGILIKYKGAYRMAHLKAIIASGLVNPETGGNIPAQQGMQIASEWIKEIGYTEATNQALQQLQDDCPFLFRVD